MMQVAAPLVEAQCALALLMQSPVEKQLVVVLLLPFPHSFDFTGKNGAE